MSLIEQATTANMIQVRRDNVILDIPADQKDYYKGLGYNVIDRSGNVIEETVPTDLAALQRFYKDAKVKIAELEAEIKELKSQKKPAKKSEKSEPVILEELKEEPIPTTPVTSTRRRKNR